ncbi:MAG: hypothetical protein R3C20_03290 [Planctomycetaceae bacterium]
MLLTKIPGSDAAIQMKSRAQANGLRTVIALIPLVLVGCGGESGIEVSATPKSATPKSAVVGAAPATELQTDSEKHAHESKPKAIEAADSDSTVSSARVWISRDGRRTVVATMAAVESGKVELRDGQGKSDWASIFALSDEDQHYIEQELARRGTEYQPVNVPLVGTGVTEADRSLLRSAAVEKYYKQRNLRFLAALLLLKREYDEQPSAMLRNEIEAFVQAGPPRRVLFTSPDEQPPKVGDAGFAGPLRVIQVVDESRLLVEFGTSKALATGWSTVEIVAGESFQPQGGIVIMGKTDFTSLEGQTAKAVHVIEPLELAEHAARNTPELPAYITEIIGPDIAVGSHPN